MAIGEPLGMERIEFKDLQTRAHIVQLTSNVTMSMNLYFEETPFTPDGESVIFRSRRGTLRSNPWDLYRVNTDGSNLIQLTDTDRFADAVLSLDGERAFYCAGKELRSVRLADGTDELVRDFEGAQAVHEMTIGGEFVFMRVVYADDNHHLVRVAVNGNVCETIMESGFFGHLTASQSGRFLSWVGLNDEGTRVGTWRVMRSDGTGERAWPVQEWSHSSWVGSTDRMQGGLLPPERALSWMHAEDEAHEIIAQGAYFVHSSATPDGEWIVSDTNWPNIGLQLVHIPSGRWDTICLDQSSFGHPQYTHPHPVISADGYKVLYNSDKTGIPQVYIVNVPDWLREELRSGAISNRHRVGS
jgi:hypothetical protein